MRILFIAIAIMFSTMLTANAAVYQQGIVYVIYAEEGEASVKDKKDLNANGVPDVVEDIATQINAAREVFKAFNFIDPIKCERYKNVTSIEIDIESSKVMGKYNGLSTRKIRKNSKHDPNEQALCIRIVNTTNPHKNWTATHEYFHLVQYSSTYFRNTWYLEGMARWAQDALQRITYPDGRKIPFILKNKSMEEKVFKGSYEMARLFWYPLAVNMKDKAKIPDKLIKKYKYVDGSPVFQDNIIYGTNVMREVLKTMHAKEELAAAKGFGSLAEWRKKGQRDERNNEIIFDCVREVYHGKL